MAKPNPFGHKRPTLAASEPRTFTDPLQEGEEWSLQLRPLDRAEMALAIDVGQDMYRAYAGDPVNGEPPTTMFPPIDGKPVAISRSDCINVSIICHMQVATTDAERCTFEQMYGLSVTMPNAWAQIVAWSNQLGKAAKGKNSSGADTAL